MFNDNLKRLRQEKGLTQQKLADLLGISRSAIGMYERGEREPDFETSELIADFFNVRLDELISDKKDNNLILNINNILPLPEMKKIPVVGQIACGEPILAVENIESYVNMPKDVKGTFALRCKGDSMINARIFDGDIVFIRQQPDVENGEIAAVLLLNENEATLKRVYKYQNRIELRPENPTYPALNFEGETLNNIRILGKAVGFLSTII